MRIVIGQTRILLEKVTAAIECIQAETPLSLYSRQPPFDKFYEGIRRDLADIALRLDRRLATEEKQSLDEWEIRNKAYRC